MQTTRTLNWTTRCSEVHCAESHSNGAKFWVRGMASTVDGAVPMSSNDSVTALQPMLATPKRCKDAKELKERLTAWSLKVAEYEHQFKAIDEAQKTFVVGD